MKIKNLLGKKDNITRRSEVKSDSIVKSPNEKRDLFESALIIGTGLLIGALCAYLLITYQVR